MLRLVGLQIGFDKIVHTSQSPKMLPEHQDLNKQQKSASVSQLREALPVETKSLVPAEN